MTYCICFAVPIDKIDAPSYFPKAITCEEITKSYIGRAALGNRTTGHAYLLSVYGHTEAILDTGPRRLRASSMFVEGVLSIGKFVPSASFIKVWQCASAWDQEYVIRGTRTIKLSEFRGLFPSSIDEGMRHVIDVLG